MPHFITYDGTTLFFSSLGSGPPLLCLPGGPGADGRGLGELGGLARDRTLMRLDGRAAGRSHLPHDQSGCGFAEQARDVVAFADHLGLDTVDVLAHSAGALVAQEFALQSPARVRRLVLVTPAGRLAREPDKAEVAEIRGRLAGRPDAAAAEAAGAPPGGYGTWSAAAQAHHAAGAAHRVPPLWLRSRFYADEESEPVRVVRLRALRAPLLAIAGADDGIAGTAPARLLTECCPLARLAVLPGCGHWPWVDAPEAFRALVADFLAGSAAD
ncbi:alpha/beta fold hydrolase [Streptomyces zagrosensis]|uniref:Pimeloyl-ACP methyl ester carboxylesterase n=1 Tax=Streptomyces zagrosensis TaxID=1042984 RepID=A0A7W9V1H5_9ACTN|nr:alpha/beta hydrolase [Streptomyces zagrosensis]MBB5938927.1 pimeloyl-ACP methyl ester carboxylesterase [Streptomyces zagrosensis]